MPKLKDAQKMLLELSNKIKPLTAIALPLEQCWERVLAEDIVSDTDFPPFDRSPLDGYAVCSRDVLHATLEKPVVLRVVDNIPAGSVGQQPIVPGTAARIMTGAPIPPGADGVVRLEYTKSNGNDVAIFTGADAAMSVCKRGEEICSGEVVLPKGTTLNAGSMGMLAMLGQAVPLVFRRPKVGILCTGSEVIAIDKPLKPGKIRDSNSFMLLAQIREAGGEPILLGNIHADTHSIVACLQSSPACDLYVTTGGASVGDYDLMEQVFAYLDVNPLFHRVAIKPGMPVLAGMWHNALLIGLSGNPAAASVSFEVLVRPVIRKLTGYSQLWRPKVKGILQGGFAKGSAARRFVWAHCAFVDDTAYVTPLLHQGNGMLKSIVTANCLIDIPANSPALTSGSQVDILLLTK